MSGIDREEGGEGSYNEKESERNRGEREKMCVGGEREREA